MRTDGSDGAPPISLERDKISETCRRQHQNRGKQVIRRLREGEEEHGGPTKQENPAICFRPIRRVIGPWEVRQTWYGELVPLSPSSFLPSLIASLPPRPPPLAPMAPQESYSRSASRPDTPPMVSLSPSGFSADAFSPELVFLRFECWALFLCTLTPIRTLVFPPFADTKIMMRCFYCV